MEVLKPRAVELAWLPSHGRASTRWILRRVFPAHEQRPWNAAADPCANERMVLGWRGWHWARWAAAAKLAKEWEVASITAAASAAEQRKVPQRWPPIVRELSEVLLRRFTDGFLFSVVFLASEGFSPGLRFPRLVSFLKLMLAEFLTGFLL